MGVGLETIFDLDNDDEVKSLTDFEKFKKLLDELYLLYEVSNNETTIEICNDHIINRSCGIGIEERFTIEFDKEGNFQHFMRSNKPYRNV